MNLKWWRMVERFCRGGLFDVAAFDAFPQLVDADEESAVRKKVSRWRDKELEQLSFLMSGTLDTVAHPLNPECVLQCQGLYLTGSENSLRGLGKGEIPQAVRRRMEKSVQKSLPNQTRLSVGSHIVPATWVHGFGWKQWRAALAGDGAMFSRPCQAQPRQAREAQAWILPVIVEKEHLLAEVETDVSAAGVSALGLRLAEALTRYLRGRHRLLTPDVRIHPFLHSCWTHGKIIAVFEWAKAVQTRAQAAGRAVMVKEHPRRGSMQISDVETGEIMAAIEPDASFPVDGTHMAIQLIVTGRPPA